MSNNEKNRKRRPSRWQASINAEKSERFMATQVSRIDWGTSARDMLASSFRSVSFGGGGETDRDTGMGGGQQQQVPGTIIRFGSGDEREFVAAAASAAASKRGSLGDSSHSNPRAGIDGSISDRYGPGSRYDATGMNLVAELADSDLSDADLSDVEGPTAVGMTRRKSTERAIMKNSGMCLKQTLVLVATIGIIIGGSFGIGFIVVQNKNNKNGATPQEQRANAPAEVLMANPSSEELEAEQQLFELAEKILTACSEKKLVVSTNECQGLCDGKGCCLKKEDSVDYCGNDEDMKCPAYVGCRALVDGAVDNMSASSADIAEEDVVIDIQRKGKYKWG